MIILSTILIMSIFCVGIYCMMEKGMILAFLKQPVLDKIKKADQTFKDAVTKEKKEYSEYKERLLQQHSTGELALCHVNQLLEVRALTKEENIETAQILHELAIDKYWILKPILLCLWCFASFWGTIAFAILQFTPLSISTDPFELVPVWLLCIICTIPLNGLFDKLFRTLNLFDEV